MSNKKRRFLPNLFRGRVIVAFLIVVQIAVLILSAVIGAKYSGYIAVALNLISFAISFVVIVSRTNDAYKLIWIYLILAFPVFGGLFYLVFSIQGSMKLMEPYMLQIENKTRVQNEKTRETAYSASTDHPNHKTLINYLSDHAGFPISDNTATKFYPTGEAFYEDLLSALRSAEKYIFLEYFIIGEGKMWDSILEILEEKTASGVTVRIIYDDFGCIFNLPKNYPEMLAEKGIECRAFNRFRPLLTGLQNNRDHRKICSVDGKIAFTGGINLADEYINEIEKYGHWKDSAVGLIGEGAWSLTVIFLKMWLLTSPEPDKDDQDISCYKPDCEFDKIDDGYAQPYCDSPLDKDQVCERIYQQMIHSAKKYLYICTPYLIIDDSMLNSLTFLAQSGVDVRIITPNKWDKRLVHITTQSYYSDLIKGGVRIYEYSPGFIHSKIFVSDDEIASIGTANLDFRSLYLHFECGTMLYGSSAVIEAKNDFLATLDECKEIRPEDCKHSVLRRLLGSFMRLISPLL
ncbi:MAG: cardiolipin synthase [Clostridia bacterium]|nr:cardiolipin synthase [Clostridia bacterium]